MPRPKIYTEEEIKQRRSNRSNEYRKLHKDQACINSQKYYQKNKDAINAKRRVKPALVVIDPVETVEIVEPVET